jgi:hypothetical protein
MPDNTSISPNIKELEKAFNGDRDLMLFWLTWVKHGLNAGDAYHELHPNVKEHSADTLGSRELKKVDILMVLQAYGLNVQKYFQQLKDGIDATKWNDFTGEREPDHKVRKEYNDKIGKLLGVEKSDGPTSLTQINVTGKNEIEFVNFKDVTEGQPSI